MSGCLVSHSFLGVVLLGGIVLGCVVLGDGVVVRRGPRVSGS